MANFFTFACAIESIPVGLMSAYQPVAREERGPSGFMVDGRLRFNCLDQIQKLARFFRAFKQHKQSERSKQRTATPPKDSSPYAPQISRRSHELAVINKSQYLTHGTSP